MKLVLSLLLAVTISAPSAWAQWQCYYATWDEETNGTGHNTPSVGVIADNIFVALVCTPGIRNFLIPYVAADSMFGRLDYYGYGTVQTSGVYQTWTDGAFDVVAMKDAFQIDAAPDGKIYVANNDNNHNILVFTLVGDTITVVSPFLRQETGPNGIFGIAVSDMGYVFVGPDTTTGVTTDIKVYAPVAQWTSNHNDPPVTTIDLPDGIYKGIAVTGDASNLFVSDYGNRRIMKYTGSPTTGYALDAGFNFQLSPGDTILDRTPSVLGLACLSPNNILFAAVDSWLGGGSAYGYGRMYLVNPFTGTLVGTDSSLNTIDVAAWNFALTGGYNLRTGGTVPGNASGYTSTYDVDFDENGNLYSQSHYGWTVEKWAYTGTLPIITTSVEQISDAIPQRFTLHQNYPNPFNPSTTIEFSLVEKANVTLTVHNVLGQEVETLFNGERGAGSYRVQFDAKNLPGGTYFYTLRANGLTEMRKMLFIK
ncbi:MAG TPA: T9SS type A sorting domain-containing protein [Bacteroidota bacterium]